MYKIYKVYRIISERKVPDWYCYVLTIKDEMYSYFCPSNGEIFLCEKFHNIFEYYETVSKTYASNSSFIINVVYESRTKKDAKNYLQQLTVLENF